MKKTIKLMRTVFAGLAVILVFLTSCEKESTEPEKPDCEVKKYGTITISNSSSNPYDIYVDNVFKIQMPGGSISTKINIDEGNNRKLYAKQVSGYLLYPTERSSSFNVLSCSDYSWQVP